MIAAPGSPEERLHALDALRATAMLLGIVLHGAASLILAPIPWPVRDVSRNFGFDVMLGAIHGFRMPVFFLLGGFFAHLLWRRYGTAGFVRQRALRIGVPLAVGMITIVPATLALWQWAAGDPLPKLTVLSYPSAHLWFLEMLLILYALAILIHWAAKRLDRAALAPRVDRMFDAFMRSPWKPFLALPATVACLWGGPALGEVAHMGFGLFPAPRAVAYFGLFFAVGWWLHRRPEHLNALGDWVKTYLAIAIVAFLVLGACHGLQLKAPGEYGWIVKLIGLSAASLYTWTMSFALCGLFLRFAGAPRPWVRYMADASYWMYLCHVPLIIWLQALVAGLALNGWLKLGFILAICLAVLLASYQWLVRYTWIGLILNGPRRRAAPAAQHHAA